MTEIEELRTVQRAMYVSDLAGFGTKLLIQQINIFRKLDRVNVVMKETSVKLQQVCGSWLPCTAVCLHTLPDLTCVFSTRMHSNSS